MRVQKYYVKGVAQNESLDVDLSQFEMSKYYFCAYLYTKQYNNMGVLLSKMAKFEQVPTS